MNIYGDWGNVLTIMRRLEWHGYKPELINYNPGDKFPLDADILIGGGGQDTGQDKIQTDLMMLSSTLHKLAENDTPMLMICGMYQLLGRSFTATSGRVIRGIGLLDAETIAGKERLIGNIITESEDFGSIVGYENHSGQTFLGDNTSPLSTVIRGAGNNNQDGTEGARYRNVIASYLHGSLLPKNPRIADFLIEKAVVKRYGQFTPGRIDDKFADLAREHALKLPR